MMKKDMGAISGSREPDHTSGSGPSGFDPARGEVRTVIVQPKYKGKPLWKWVGKRFASLLYFDPGTFVLGAEILEAGVMIFIGPFMLAFAHIKRQAAAFDRLDIAIATEARRAETPKDGSVHEGAGRNGIAQDTVPGSDMGKGE